MATFRTFDIFERREVLIRLGETPLRWFGHLDFRPGGKRLSRRVQRRDRRSAAGQSGVWRCQAPISNGSIRPSVDRMRQVRIDEMVDFAQGRSQGAALALADRAILENHGQLGGRNGAEVRSSEVEHLQSSCLEGTERRPAQAAAR